MPIRILIVDDEPHIRKVMRLALESDEYEVFEASSGEEALDLMTAAAKADVMLLDERMPSIDGLETLRRLSDYDSKPVVIMVTAFASIELAVGAMKLGATDFVRKPMSPDTLRTAVDGALAKARGGWPATPEPTLSPISPSYGLTMAWWKREPSHVPEPALAEEDLALIRLESVTKHFPGEADEPAVALAEVTVEITRGEFVSVSGPSGCGKSTFLSILGLLDTPTSGRYYLKGRATDRLSPTERARTRNVDIGLVFQSFNLIGDLTVYENVEYPLTIKGASPEERRRRVMAALDRVGLAARAKQRPGSLSGGHQQLVSIARAIAGQPPIILADEPTGNLDSAGGETVMKAIQELHTSGSTICLATHDPRYIGLATRHIRLFDGRVVAS